MIVLEKREEESRGQMAHRVRRGGHPGAMRIETYEENLRLRDLNINHGAESQEQVEVPIEWRPKRRR